MNMVPSWARPLHPKRTARYEAANPTYIGIVAGFRFYENPFLGDEAPLLVTIDGVWFESDFYELPDFHDIVD